MEGLVHTCDACGAHLDPRDTTADVYSIPLDSEARATMGQYCSVACVDAANMDTYVDGSTWEERKAWFYSTTLQRL